MNPNSSLDDILKEIQRDTVDAPPLHSSGTSTFGVAPQPSIGMQDVSAHLTLDLSGPIAQPGSGAGPTSLQPETGSPPQDLWGSNLTERQRALPKLSLRMLGGLAAAVVLMLGLGSATFLSQQNQDLRQQAYVDTLPEITGPSAIETSQEMTGQGAMGEEAINPIGLAQEQFMNVEGQLSSPVNELFLVGLALGVVGLVVIGALVWLLKE